MPCSLFDGYMFRAPVQGQVLPSRPPSARSASSVDNSVIDHFNGKGAASHFCRRFFDTLTKFRYWSSQCLRCKCCSKEFWNLSNSKRRRFAIICAVVGCIIVLVLIAILVLIIFFATRGAAELIAEPIGAFIRPPLSVAVFLISPHR